MSHRLLLLETVAESADDILNHVNDVEKISCYEKDPLTSEIDLSTVDVIITRGKGQVRQELLNKCSNLKIVARCGVGLDNIDVDACTRMGIKVVNAPNANADTIAEHTLSLMLALHRNLYRSIAEVKQNNWQWRTSFEGDEIRGKTLGILGLGNIGSKVARLALAFGMHVKYWSERPNPDFEGFCSFDEVISNSDLLTLHLPLTPATNGLISEQVINRMKPGAALINTARGAIINEKALIAGLISGQIGGFAADVLTEEPPKQDYELLGLPNVLITGHVGSLTATTYTKMCVDTINNVLALLGNQPYQPNCIFNQAALANS